MASVILFDGVCNLCNGLVKFVITRDPGGQFQFAPMQSEAARRLIGSRGGRPLPDSLALVDDGRVWTRSDAALRIARRLSFPWSAVYWLVVVPRPLRDRIYDVVARNRYRWFGRRDVCMVPTPALTSRFLEAEPHAAVDTPRTRQLR